MILTVACNWEMLDFYKKWNQMNKEIGQLNRTVTECESFNKARSQVVTHNQINLRFSRRFCRSSSDLNFWFLWARNFLTNNIEAFLHLRWNLMDNILLDHWLAKMSVAVKFWLFTKLKWKNVKSENDFVWISLWKFIVRSTFSNIKFVSGTEVGKWPYTNNWIVRSLFPKKFYHIWLGSHYW